MGDRIDEAILMFVAANLSNKENCIEDQPSDNCEEEDEAKHQNGNFPPVQQDPTYVQRYSESNEAGAQRDEECNFGISTRCLHAAYSRRTDPPESSSLNKTAQVGATFPDLGAMPCPTMVWWKGL